jgi:hypothetical protein
LLALQIRRGSFCKEIIIVGPELVLSGKIPREIITIDGKTVKGSFNTVTGKALHIVSAWVQSL